MVHELSSLMLWIKFFWWRLRLYTFFHSQEIFRCRDILVIDVLVICPIVVLKLAVTICIALYFQTLWPNWLNFFRSLKKILFYDRKENGLYISGLQPFLCIQPFLWELCLKIPPSYDFDVVWKYSFVLKIIHY